MSRQINEAGLNLIKYFEGLRLTSYQDEAGIWTIGYGHTGNVQAGLVITQEAAETLLVTDIQHTVDYVNAALIVPILPPLVVTSPNQFASMCSLCYNIGIGNFRTSSVLKFHKANEIDKAAYAFLLWDKVTIDGQLVESPGLVARRYAERALYLTA
jgi:lysozyme